MDGNVVLLGGLGYLGYNLAEYFTSKGLEVYILARSGSIRYRVFTARKILDIGGKVLAYRDLYTVPIREIGQILDGGILINLIGVNRGNMKRMIWSNAYLPYLFARSTSKYSKGFNYIYISAYNTYQYNDRNGYGSSRYISRYGESKTIGEKLTIKLGDRGNIDVFIIRPGIVIGRYPFHPEWHFMYQIGKKGIMIETGVYTAYTPYEVIGEISTNLDLFKGDMVINAPIYFCDFGTPTIYFYHFFKHRRGGVVKYPTLDVFVDLLPYDGITGFIKEFLSAPKVPKPDERVLSLNYPSMRDSLYSLFKSIGEIYGDPEGRYQLVRLSLRFFS